MESESILHQFIIFLISFPFLCLSLESDTISSGIVVKDPDSIVSPGRVFKLGFFTPDNTANRYLAVFYAVSEKTPLWIANRDSPLTDSSSTVSISDDGNLVLINARNQTVWSTNATISPSNATARILDSGNLVLRDDAAGITVWDSFSHPDNVFVPSMMMTDNINTGKKVFLTSWKNETDPGAGSFTGGLEATYGAQLFVFDDDGRPRWKSGPWNGQILIGVRDMYSPYLDGFTVVKDGSGTFYFTAPEGKMLMKVELNSTGTLEQSLWDDQRKSWDTVWVAPQNECEVYGTCGAFGMCDIQDSPICSCLRGFEPVDGDGWGRGNWSGGCKRKKPLQCSGTDGTGGSIDGFLKMQFMRVPDLAESFPSKVLDECRSVCLGNCSCLAYAHDSYIGCMLWRNTLIDVQDFNGVGVDLYVRLSASELERHKDKKLYIIIPVVVGFVAISICIFIACCWIVKRRGNKRKNMRFFEAGRAFSSDSAAIVLKDESERLKIEELPLFTFKVLASATNQFRESSLLGRGGFGPVYKGNLSNGREIAVKRLSAASRQGVQEFMNEVVVISKLQHRNLVRLLGCCAEKDEKMLIYEYMPNKSLDVCLFDPAHPSRNVLDWSKRFSIIEGIGRGLLYLHKDSRLRIIHRDLKPSNVLLDENWNPKISDFGMARIFGGNEDHGNTAKVVGTYGYMAPEYAMEGRFSDKSDVYSFGVLMLEIIKGKKNTNYYNHQWSLSLIGCAWKLWSEGNGSGFADESIARVEVETEIKRCIQIALLCVQEYPADRPTIQTALEMLSREIVEVPAPEQPVFAEKWIAGSANQVGQSSSDLTLTAPHGR